MDRAPPQSMRNDDFRKFLTTPRQQQSGRHSGQNQRPRDGKPKPGRRPFRPPGGRGSRGQDDEEDEDGPKYRDRAAERRQGINPDYDETELAALTGDAVAKLTVEETKFLGGDIDHTHLVRGLDFQLLNRVRENLNKQPSSKKRDEQPIKPLEAMPPPTALPPPRAAMPWAPAPKTTPTPKTAGHAPNAVAGPNFATPLGRRVYDAIFRPPRVEVSEHFLPRRTAFVYELDALDVPTTLRRSQADCPKVEERMLAVMHDQLLERIAKIMSHVGPSGKRRKKVQRLADAATGAADAPVAAPVAAQQEHGQGQARQQAEVPATMPAEEDVGDIFEDAGTEYVPTLPPKDALGDAPPASAKAGGVFATPAPRPVAAAAAPTLPDTKTLLREVEEGDEDGDEDVGPAPPPADMDADDAYGAYPEPEDVEDEGMVQYAEEETEPEEALKAPRGLPKFRRRQADGRPALPSNLQLDDDAYAELYPERFGGFAEELDSDEESKAAKEDKEQEGADKKKLQGKAMRTKAKLHDNKINTDLGKIKGMLEDKYGDKHSSAFVKKDKAKRDAAEGQADPAPPTQRAKRLKL